MSNEVPLHTERRPLPSGGWFTFRPTVSFGARRQLNELSMKMGARIRLSSDGKATPEAIELSEQALLGVMKGLRYFPVTYMLTAWSYDLPLPTMENLAPLDDVSIEDGEELLAQAEKAVNGRVDFGPSADADSPTAPSPALNTRSAGAL